MDRRNFIHNSLAATGAAVALGLGTAQGAPMPDGTAEGAPMPAGPSADGTGPNVIWICGDQHRALALSCNGDPNVHTPNMDILSGMGVNFDHAVSSCPLCAPFRGSLLTSRYAHHCVPVNGYPLPPGQPTITKPFHEAGYQTAHFGKWHLAGPDGKKESAMQIVPPDRRGGFDEWIGYNNNNSQWDCWVHGGSGKDAFQYRLPGYETDELTNLLIKYLKERGAEAKSGKGRPFFASLAVQPPHTPNLAPAEFMSHYNGGQLELRPNVPPVEEIQKQTRLSLAGYYAQIENLDWNIGRVRKALHDSGLEFNTYILLFSDHGDMMGSHGIFTKTWPQEESVRIPMIVSGGVPHPGGRPSVPFNSVDIAPTTLGLCGIKKPSWMEGTDYSHYHLGHKPKEGEPDSAYLELPIPEHQPDHVDKPWRGLVTRDGWKYCCFANTSWLMFNLNEDPYELINLAHNDKVRVERKKLIERLKQWVSDTGDKFEVPAE